MTVGLPGTGIGGLFYLLSALAMPVIELFRRMRQGPSKQKWRVAVSQFRLGVSMLAVLAASGLGIDYAIGASQSALEWMVPGEYEGSRQFSLGVVPTFITLGVLAAALLVIELTGIAMTYLSGPRTRPRVLSPDLVAPDQPPLAKAHRAGSR